MKRCGVRFELSIIDKWWLTSWITHLLSLYNSLQLTKHWNWIVCLTTTAKGLNKLLEWNKKMRNIHYQSIPSNVKTRVSQNLGWVYYYWQPRQNGTQKKNLLGRVATQTCCDLWPRCCWPTKILDFYEQTPVPVLHRWENGWIAVPVPVPDPHAKMEPRIRFGFHPVPKIRPSSSSVLGNPGSRTGVSHLVTLQLAFGYIQFCFV